jgi:hypothetical protein
MHCFVQKKLSVIVLTIADYYSNTKEDSPTTVSKLYTAMYADLLALDEFLSKSFNETKSERKLKPTKPNITIKKDKFSLDIEKIFAERIQYLPPLIELGRKPVLSTLIKCILKSIIETLRENTLSSDDFKQLQIDLAFLRIYFPQFIDGADFNLLLDECLNSGLSRCTNVKMIDVYYIF